MREFAFITNTEYRIVDERAWTELVDATANSRLAHSDVGQHLLKYLAIAYRNLGGGKSNLHHPRLTHLHSSTATALHCIQEIHYTCLNVKPDASGQIPMAHKIVAACAWHHVVCTICISSRTAAAQICVMRGPQLSPILCTAAAHASLTSSNRHDASA